MTLVGLRCDVLDRMTTSHCACDVYPCSCDLASAVVRSIANQPRTKLDRTKHANIYEHGMRAYSRLSQFKRGAAVRSLSGRLANRTEGRVEL